jgi:hypothetical protein
MKNMIERLKFLTWGIAVGFGTLELLWRYCPCWDEPTGRQQVIMLVTLLPLCMVTMAYLLAVLPICFAMAILVDLMEGNL